MGLALRIVGVAVPINQFEAKLRQKLLEMTDLRKHPIYKSRALLFPYAPSPAPSNKHTTGLDIGTQNRIIEAARTSYDAALPINTLLTVRWANLQENINLNFLQKKNTLSRIHNLVENVRHWLTRRDYECNYIWARETTDAAGEHWHFGFHLPETERDPFINYLEKLLVEPRRARPLSQQTRGEFACSEYSSWHLAGEIQDGKRQFTGYWISAYLGKGEPSHRTFRGKLINNQQKPVRGLEYGGKIKGGKYDALQGEIKGTTARKGRFDISRSLK